MKRYHFIVTVVLLINLWGLSIAVASNNSEARANLLRKITTIHSKWQIVKEKEIDRSQMLVEAQNSFYPQLRPIWLLNNGVIYSINGAAKTLTKDVEFSYDLTPSEAIDIIEGRKDYKGTVNKETSWNTPDEAITVLKTNGFITEKEASIIKKFDAYIDNPSNSDSSKAVENWAKKNNITRKRLNEIDSMRHGYKSIAAVVKAGFVKVGEKKTINEIGKPTGKLIKKFDVSYKKTATAILIEVQTDLPDGAPLMIDISKTGLKDDDTWIGNQSKTTVKNGRAEVTIPLTTHRGGTLKKGRYDVEILFNSFWSAFQKDVAPNVKTVVGEFGENLKTPFTGKFEREGKQYRTIDFKKKAAFSVP